MILNEALKRKHFLPNAGHNTLNIRYSISVNSLRTRLALTEN